MGWSTIIIAVIAGLGMGYVVAGRVKAEEPEGYKIIGGIAGVIAALSVWLVITYMW